MAYHDGAGKDIFGTNWWVRGTITAISSDFSITSRTDHGVGDFTYTLDNSIATNTNYNRVNGSADAVSSHIIIRNTARISTTVVALKSLDDTGAAVDVNQRAFGSGVTA